jgi:archaemetzincin
MLLLAVVVLFSVSIYAKVPMVHVYTYGNFDRQKAARYVSEIRKYYSNVKLESEKLVLPSSAFYSPRQRYLAYFVLVSQYKYCPKGDYIIGVTDKDISMNRMVKGQQINWGIMGLTDKVGGHSCIFSSYRVKKDDDMKYLMLHELGHAFGLKHCSNRCLMQDAHGKNKFGYLRSFCPSCKAVLKLKGWKLY